jgi:predicted transcriptional regulator
LSFPTLERNFDYKGFSSKDPRVIEWCTELFESYWKDRLPPLPDVWKDVLPS